MKFKEIAHLYLGCKVFIEGGIIGTLNQVDTNKLDITCYDTVFAYPKFEQVTPILRHIKSITKDEILELICHHPKHGPNEVEYLGKFGTSLCYRVTFQGPERKYQKMYQTSHFGETPQQFNYLISKGFDVFGLIEAGEAINQKRIFNNKTTSALDKPNQK